VVIGPRNVHRTDGERNGGGRGTYRESLDLAAWTHRAPAGQRLTSGASTEAT